VLLLLLKIKGGMPRSLLLYIIFIQLFLSRRPLFLAADSGNLFCVLVIVIVCVGTTSFCKSGLTLLNQINHAASSANQRLLAPMLKDSYK